jgi:flavin-dependent dehydrogenase
VSEARRDAEVLIVGGGPAGAAAAWFLARSGVDVLLVDRARFPRDKPCAEYLSPQASRVLDEMGVLSRIEASAPAHLTGMRVRAPNGAVIHGEFAAGHGFRGFRDTGLALRRVVLDAILLDAARAAGVRVEEGVVVRDVLRDADGSVAGVRADRAGGSSELKASLTIGADGLRSVVGRRLGLVRQGRWPRRVALVAHFEGVANLGDMGEMHVASGSEGYLGIAHVGSGVANVAAVVPTSRAAELRGDAEGFLARWIEARPHLAPRFAAARRLTTVTAVGPFNVRAKRAWLPGAALVGDAADFFDPFTGEGIYTALRGGELLALYAHAALRASSPRKSHEALAAYDRARRHEFAGKWRVERLVGMAVAFPALLNRAALALQSRRDMADLLVGVTGDFVPAREVLRPSYWLRLAAASLGAEPAEAGSPTQPPSPDRRSPIAVSLPGRPDRTPH